MSSRLRKALTKYENLLEETRETRGYMAKLMASYLLNIVDIVEETGRSVEIINPMYSFRPRIIEIRKDGVSERRVSYVDMGRASRNYSLKEFKDLCRSFNIAQKKSFKEALESIEDSWVNEMITDEMLEANLEALEY